MSFIHRRKTGKKLRVAIIFGLMLYVFMGTMLYFFQEKLLFRPTQLPQDHVFEFKHDFEEFYLDTDDGAIINTLLFKAENPKGAILYYHGNAGDLQRWGTIVAYFVDLNYDVYIMDYRGYGKSRGRLNERLMYKDAIMVFEHLKAFWDKDQITVYGRSLGSAFATYVASKFKPKQLILESPFHSVEDVAKSRFPIFPVSALIKFKFKNYEYIQAVDCPITIIHGTDDYVVPMSSGEKLFKSTPKQHSNFVSIKDGGHNNLVEFEAFRNYIENIL